MGRRHCPRGGGWLLSVLFVVLAIQQEVEGQEDITVTILFNSSAVSVTEGSNVGIQLIAQGTYDRGFTVNLTFQDGSASLVKDYLYPGFPAVIPSVTFAPGSLSSTVFNVIAIGNNAFDGQRRFSVRFELPEVPGLRLRPGRPDRLSVSIADDDFVAVSFERPSQEVVETIGSIPVQLQSKGLYSRPFQVSFTCVEVAPVEAEDGQDFISEVHTVTFDTTGTEETMSTEETISILDDKTSESTESFICVILRPHGLDGIVVEDPNTISFAILDDDNLQVTFENDSYTGEEGTSFPGIRLLATDFAEPFKVQIFVFTLDADVTQKEVEADINVDYRDPQVQVGNGVVSFNRMLGLASTPLTIELLSDNIAEGTEYFGLTFVAVTDENEDNPVEIMPVNITQVLVAIEDTNEIFVRLNTSRIEVAEDGGSVDVYFEVVREESPGVYVPAEYTFDFNLTVTTEGGSATADADFVNKTDTVTFTAGEQYSSPFTITINEDTVSEGPEDFNVNYSIVGSSVRDGAIVSQLDTTATVVINDNDITRISFEEDSQTVREADHVVMLRLVADNVFEREQVIRLSTNDGTTDGAPDYRLLDNRVRFPPNSNVSNPFRVQIVNDVFVEDTEEFSVSFTIPDPARTSGARRGAITRHTITIEDDDKIFIQFEREEYVIDEDGGNIEIRLVVHNGTVYQPFNVTVELVDGTALDLQDAVLIDSIATFQVNDNISSVVFLAITEDFILEGDEMFTLRGELSSETATFVEILPPNPEVTIRDNDVLIVSLTTPDVTVTEGTDSEVMLTVITDIVAAFPFHVYLNPVDRTAENGNDFTAADPIRVDFPAFEQSVSVSIPLINDSVAEPMERFRVELEVPSEFTTRNITVGGNVRTIVNINDDDCVTVTITTDKVGTTEGSNLPLTVTVDGDFSEPFEVVIAMTDGTATGGADFDNTNLNILFEPNGAKVQEREVEILGDDLNEGDEWFIVTLSRVSSTSMCYKIENGTLNMTIGDDDGITIYFQQGEYSVEEGTDLSVHLNISGHIQYPFTVEVLPCSQLNGPLPDTKIPDGANKATIDDDFSRAPVPVTFQPGMLVSTIAVIDIVNDGLLEGPELFELCFQLDEEEENRKITPGDPESAVVTITDDPPDAVCVSLSTDAYSADEDDGFIIVTIETDKQSFVIPFDFVLTISDPFVTNDGDIPTLEYTVSMPTGASSVTQAIAVNPDFVLEDNETFLVTLQPTQAAMEVRVSTCPQSGEANITIVNDDMEIEFEDSEVPVVERKEPGEFCLRRRGDVRSEVNITVSTGTITGNRPAAMADEDYLPLDNMVVTFMAGSDMACFQVMTQDDTVWERPTDACHDPDRYEYVSVMITSASTQKATKWDTSTSELVIEDDDFELRFANSSITVSESVPMVDVCVNMCGYRDEPVMGFIFPVDNDDPSITGTTPPPTPHPHGLSGSTSGSGSGMIIMIDPAELEEDVVTDEIMLVFPAGSMVECDTLIIKDDETVENIEEFTLALEEFVPNPRAKRQTQGSRRRTSTGSTLRVAILDNDVLMFNLTVVPQESVEGTRVLARILATVEYEIDFMVSFVITDGTAIRYLDYNFHNVSLMDMFTPGDNTHTMEIAFLEDNIVEGAEMFTVAMMVSGSSRPFRLPPPVEVTILDEDRLCVMFSSPAYSVNEGDSVSLVLILEQEIGVPVRVDIAFNDGIAVSPGDFDSATQTIRFEPGSRMGSVTIATESDNIIENTESFTGFYRRVRGVGADVGKRGCRSTTTVNILDTTRAEVVFDPVNYTTTEGTPVTLVLKLDAEVAPGVTRTVDVRTMSGTAQSPEDYVGGVFTVTFTGTNEASLDIVTTENSIVEGTEMFTAIIENPSSPLITPGTDDTATVTITDDDTITVEFTQAVYNVNETDGTAVITLETSGTHDVNITVTVSVRSGTATFGADYNTLTTNVMFAPGETMQSFEITILDDKILERDEDIDLTLFVNKSSLRSMVLPGTLTRSRVIIIDDEEVVVSFSQAEYGEYEFDEAIPVTVEVTGNYNSVDPNLNISIAVNATGITATEDVDYVGTLYPFTPTPPSFTFTITVIDEDEVEQNETIDLSFDIPSPLTNIVKLGDIPRATAVIIDDSAKVVSFNVSASEQTVVEGNGFTLPLTLNYVCVAPFTIDVVVTGGTAEGGADYASGPYTVTFPGRSLMTNLVIPTVDDPLFEGSENVSIAIQLRTSQQNIVSVGTQGELELTIEDNEAASIQFNDTEYRVMESGGQVMIPIVATVSGGGTFQDGFVVRATVNTIDDTATGGTDFVAGPYDLAIEFDPATNTHVLVINLTTDSITEFEERFNITLTVLTPGIDLGGNSMAVVIIEDPPVGRICTFATPAVVTPFNSDPNPAQYNVERSCDYQLVTVCDGSYDFTVDVDIIGTDLSAVGVAISLNGTTYRVQGGQSIPSLGLSVNYDITSREVTVEVIATSPVYTSLCGLCGNSDGQLVDKEGNVVPLNDREEVNRVVETYRLPPEQSLFLPARTECAVLKNDSVTSDPLLTIPILIPGNTNPDLENPSLCLELHGDGGKYFNYISDTCVSMNAEYRAVDPQTNVISGMGLIVGGRDETCHMIQVNLDGCTAFYDGLQINTTYRDDGVVVSRRGDRGVVRIEAPNCNSTSLVVWAMCQEDSGVEFMKIVVTRGINLQPTSHGIMGQFWNVPVEVELYDGEYGSGSAQDVNTYYTVKVTHPDSTPRQFVAEYGSYLWSYTQTPCLYAGNRQGGPLREVKDGPNDSAIEGLYRDYIASDFFATDHTYNRFDNSRCT